MDVDIKDIESATLTKKDTHAVLGKLTSVIEEASDIRDRKDVQDPALHRALQIVEEFLRTTNCICYGGMAINAHLPEPVKFYDFEKVLPDYDFFTPTPEQHIEKLVGMLSQESFDSVAVREGMHEGTHKVFVNYHGVADITYMPPWMFRSLSHRTITDNGIHYADAEFLRMNMYLELSRPLGEVERWDKVYKRLVLLNRFSPPDIQNCHRDKTSIRIPIAVHQKILEYVIQHDLIFLGADLEKLYLKPGEERAKALYTSRNPVIVFSPNLTFHVEQLKKLLVPLVEEHIDMFQIQRQGDLIPGAMGLSVGGNIYFLAIEQQFCHSFNTIPYKKEFGKRLLRIASLDTAIYMFYLLSFVREFKGLVPYNTPCFAKRLVEISIATRDRNKSGKFPLFPLTCEGHQPTKASLIRAKVERVRRARAKTKRLALGAKSRRSRRARRS